MDLYGDAATADMRIAHEKVVRLATAGKTAGEAGYPIEKLGVGDGN
jgi:hypothetical protein